jgi:hypothetical protein
MTTNQALTLLQEAATFGTSNQKRKLRTILALWGATQADLQEGTILANCTEEEYAKTLELAVKTVGYGV